jgi:hypothetical protein
MAHKEMLMDEISLTRSSPSSTRTIVADEAFCAQVAALLLCDWAPIHDAFIGEPAEEVLEMVRWALSHEDDAGFDATQVLTTWARKRGRGAWSERPPRRMPNVEQEAERLAVSLAQMWTEHPASLAEAIRALERSRDTNGRS